MNETTICKWLPLDDQECIDWHLADGWKVTNTDDYHSNFSLLAVKEEQPMLAINRFEVLDDAKAAVEDREGTYGTPQKNYERVAAIMQVILGDKLRPGHTISAADAVMCVGLSPKLTRLIQSPDHNDSQVDLAGYAALMSEVV